MSETISSNLSYERAKRSRSDEKPYKCQLCQKSFTTSSYMKKHQRLHTGKKPYKCQLCEKSFTQCGSLEAHMRSHTGEKPYQCQLCQKSFTQSGTLEAHMRSHTGEKPYKCQLCQKSFTSCSALKIHMRTHSGEKPYTCQLCKKSFSQAGHLKAHMRTHTGERSYICESCDERFTDLRNLTRHRRSHMDGEQHIWSEPYSKRSSSTRQFKLHAGIQSSADPSFQLVSLSSKCVMEKQHDVGSRDMHLGSNDNKSPLPKITKIKSLEDATPFMEKSFGCGICGEMLQFEKKFLEHCSGHYLSAPDNLVIGLC